MKLISAPRTSAAARRFAAVQQISARSFAIGADIWGPSNPGHHVDSYYSRSRCAVDFKPLTKTIHADVAIIGGGLAGMNTALSLAQRGASTVVLESNKLGWAASGRNGGFAHPGYSLDLFSLEAAVGRSHARALWNLSFQSLDIIKQRLTRWEKAGRVQAASTVQPGMVVCSWFDRADATRAEVEAGNEILGQEYFQFWDRSKVRDLYKTSKYFDAIYDPASFHFHSLNYGLEVATDASTLGAQIFEESPVITTEKLPGGKRKLVTPDGAVIADHIVYASSSYCPSLPGMERITRAILPVMTYACVTEPLGDALQQIMQAPHAVTDSRFACDYYRPLQDTRLLWGGRIDCLGINPQKLRQVLHQDMCKVYPQLQQVGVQVAWSGAMGYARHKMPLIGQLEPGVWYCTAFGGHGVGPTTIGGELIATAIAQHDQRYKLFKPFDLQWAGGPIIGAAAAQAFYWWYELRDQVRGLRYNIARSGEALRPRSVTG